MEPEDHPSAQSQHHSKHYKISIFSIKFRHIDEIHAVNASDQRQGHEDRGDDGQRLHDAVHPVRVQGNIGVP
ncbi:hypothetical protein D3C71_2084490 [compost metagenome]